MRVVNLGVGQIIRNYKELCNELEIEVKTGKSRQYQLLDLERYIRYSKSGHKFIIEEVYKQPLEKIDNRGLSKGSRNNNDIYGDLIQLLVLDLLVQGDNKGEIIISRGRLLQSIHMVNSNYSYCGRNVPQLSKYTNIDEGTIYDFYNTSKSNFRGAVETALRNLDNKKLILYDVVKMACVSDRFNNRNVELHRELNKEERIIRIEIEKDVLELLGYKNERDVRMSRDWNNYKSEVSQRLQMQSNIIYCYDAYRITVNEKYIYSEYESLLDLLLEDMRRIELKNELNDTVQLRQITNAKTRHSKGFNSRRMSKVRLSHGYVENSNKLIGLLIDNNTGNIRRELEDINDSMYKLSAEERELIELIDSLD